MSALPSVRLRVMYFTDGMSMLQLLPDFAGRRSSGRGDGSRLKKEVSQHDKKNTLVSVFPFPGLI